MIILSCSMCPKPVAKKALGEKKKQEVQDAGWKKKDTTKSKKSESQRTWDLGRLHKQTISRTMVSPPKYGVHRKLKPNYRYETSTKC